MFRTMCKSKIHRATVAGADLNYAGSITIGPALMEAAKLLPYEQVKGVNANNGVRFETYVIPETKGEGEICPNVSAAPRVHPGEKVIVISYARYDASSAATYEPLFIFVDEHNRLAAGPNAKNRTARDSLRAVSS